MQSNNSHKKNYRNLNQHTRAQRSQHALKKSTCINQKGNPPKSTPKPLINNKRKSNQQNNSKNKPQNQTQNTPITNLINPPQQTSTKQTTTLTNRSIKNPKHPHNPNSNHSNKTKIIKSINTKVIINIKK